MDIKIRGLYKAYGQLQVFSGLSLDLAADKIHCFFGPSGCGKTTLANLIAGVTRADGGEIEGTAGRSFSYVFQEDRLLPWATLEENLKFVLSSRYSKEGCRAQMEKYLALVELENFRNSLPEELSGGMRQRAAIARAFACESDILILDEAFKGLHLELKKSLMDYVKQYKQRQGSLIILITHDIEDALYLADEIHYLGDGGTVLLSP